MTERMSAERKAQLIQGLQNNDTFAVKFREEIAFNRPDEILGEIKAEQEDAEDQRTLTAAAKPVVASLLSDKREFGGDWDESNIPAYLMPEAATA